MDALVTNRQVDEVRQLGEQERLIHFVHNLGGLIAVTVLHLRGEVDTAVLRRALDWLQRRRPLLGAHIEYRGFGWDSRPPFMHRKACFVTRGTTEIPLEVQRVEPGKWLPFVQREMRTRFTRRYAPGMRVTLLRETDDLCHLVIACDHTICDAQAAAMHSCDIMEFLGDPAAAPDPGRTRLPPALEDNFTPASNPARPYERAARLPRRRVQAPWETRFETRVLSSEETTALHDAVRSHRTTMHGAVTAAVLTAAGGHFGLDTLTSLHNVELRKLSKPPLPSETYGCYIDIVRTTHALDRPFWSLATDVAFKLVMLLSRHQKQASVLQLFGRNEYRYDVAGIIRNQFAMDGIGVTTAGDFGLRRQYGSLVLDDLTTIVSQYPYGVGIYVLALEFQGALRLTLGYGAQRIAASDVSAIAERAIGLLRNPPAG